jgi:hypothetical protein
MLTERPGLADEAAKAAWDDIEAELDPDVYDTENRARVLDRAQTAADSAREEVQGKHWQSLYDRYLQEELQRLSPARPSTEDLEEGESRTFCGELTPRSERRY